MDLQLVSLHNILRWVILILLLASLIKAFAGWQQKKVFAPADRKLWLATLIASHITLLLGLYQWLYGRMGMLNTPAPPEGMMKNKTYRFFWMEHPLLMIIAIILITVGYGMAKKKVADRIKYKKAFWFFVVAMILILAAIPWPFRGLEIARPLLPEF